MDQNRAKGVGHCETYTITEITTCKYVLIITTPSPRPCGTGSILVYWNTGAEAPAYYQSASPRRHNVARASSAVVGVWTFVGSGMLRRSKIFIVTGLKHAISSVGAASNRD
jgi:hypothetical protein